MDNLERIELLQKIIRKEIEQTEKRILFLLQTFEFPEELRKEALEALGKTEDTEDNCDNG